MPYNKIRRTLKTIEQGWELVDDSEEKYDNLVPAWHAHNLIKAIAKVEFAIEQIEQYIKNRPDGPVGDEVEVDGLCACGFVTPGVAKMLLTDGMYECYDCWKVRTEEQEVVEIPECHCGMVAYDANGWSMTNNGRWICQACSEG